MWESGSEAFASSTEHVTLGLGVATGKPSRGSVHGSGSRSRSAPRFKLGFLYASSAAAAVAAVFLIWWLMSDVHETLRPLPVYRAYDPVVKAVELATKRGAFVLPGGEGAIADGNGVSYRSGYIPLDDELRIALGSMFEAYRRGDHSKDLLYWLIAGHVATGQMKAAREIVEHARKIGVEDSRIAIIEAIISFALGETAAAERKLRDLLAVQPGNCLAEINLAVLLIQQGDTVEANERLRHIYNAGEMHLRARASILLTD